MSFLDDLGQVVTTQDRRICSGNTEMFFVPLLRSGAEARAGSVRVISRPLGGRPWETAAEISATALGFRHSDPARGETLESYAYPLLPEQAVGPWPFGGDPSSVDPGQLGPGRTAEEHLRGSAILALPGLIHQPAEPANGNGEAGDATVELGSSEIVVSNFASLPGRTEADLILLDESRRVMTRTLRLEAGQAQRIRLSELGLEPGFRGSAIVSATYWNHALLGPLGDGRRVVGLGAVAITRVGENARGGARGGVVVAEPLRQLPVLPVGGTHPDGGATPPVRNFLPYAARDHRMP